MKKLVYGVKVYECIGFLIFLHSVNLFYNMEYQYQYHFEKLEVWNQSRQLVVAVYRLIKKFPPEEKFALCNQLRRSVISVPSNIAEGISRLAVKETIHFLEIAFGSLMEVYCQLQIAVDLQYITEKDFEEIKPLIISTSKLLNGLHKAKTKQIE